MALTLFLGQLAFWDMSHHVRNCLEIRAAELLCENIGLLTRLGAAIGRTLLTPDIPFTAAHLPAARLARTLRRVSGELGPLRLAVPRHVSMPLA